MSAPTAGQLRVVHDSGDIFLMDKQSPQFMVARIYPGPAAEASAERLARCWNAHDGLVGALERLLFAAENADETGYVTDAGFVDLDAIYEQARAALAAAREAL